ncbi:MAG: hypothetical protein ACREBO_11120 [Novosphingobium sp.]
MRYVIMAVAGIFATVNWLGTADGQRAKAHFFENNRQTAHYSQVSE